MELQFEINRTLVSGNNAALYQGTDGSLHLLYKPTVDSAPTYAFAEFTDNDWSTVQPVNQHIATNDKDATDLEIVILPDTKTWFKWHSKGTIRVAIDVDEKEVFDNASPHRLFYAVDSQKLYQNVSDNWEFVASPQIANLEGYQALLDRIVALEARIVVLGG